ncbi:conserved membrane hypothetical protein [Frankia canadensis]|uniref:Glycosyltransferase RgtA/B/C/D-like domain-containing protein n=1 Tax=Frankia canadensis TaxID=1836972 RepID=A0A2I2KUF0_9ACTN|nr:hypothetical protein [Frankia canadensis]SNQ49279.1 conserved membrane hypothetical protein [Frankia canadensis]SOU56569.1 conserved membrane hypothetical protein [Frankia canadensis]
MVALGLAVAVIGVEIALHARISRPLWYDELWRPHFAGEPWRMFWPELRAANTPSSLGSIALTRVSGDALGWHAWALRLVTAGVWLPVLAVAVYLYARRFTGVAAAVGTAVAVALSGTVIDAGTQLKPYALEAVVSLAVLALWTTPGAGLRRRTAAGALALVSLPAVFLLVPLAAADVLRAGRAASSRTTVHTVGLAVGRAAGRVAPALLLAGGHAALFVSHQSSQRASHFWDDQFLAGRGVVGGLRFTADQVRAILGGTPPGIDRYDPNLVHALLEGHRTATTIVGAATAVAMLAGVRALSRRPDGVTLLIAVGGAELVTLLASGARYWPFGACRTNLFLVPLLAVVAAAGAGELATMAATTLRRTRPALTATSGAKDAAGMAVAVACAVVVVGVAAVPVSAGGGVGTLWRERHEVRPIEGLVAATGAVRTQYREGDAVIIGGRLARAGWLYGMELSDDARVGRAPRIPRSATTFLTVIGRGDAERAVRARPHRPGAVLLFVLAYDRRGTTAELVALRRGGWCERSVRSFPLTGNLHELATCPVTASRRPATSPTAGPSTGGPSTAGTSTAGTSTTGSRQQTNPLAKMRK